MWDLRDLTVHVTQAMVSTVDTRWRGQDATDHETRCYLPIAGDAEIAFDGRRHRLVPGHCVLIPGHRPRTFHCRRSMTLKWMHCVPGMWGGLDACRLLPLRPLVVTDDAGWWSNRFDDLIAWRRASTAADRLRLDATVRLILAEFLKADPPSAQLVRFRSVVAFIEAHLADRLTVAGLARLMAWDPAHFARRFRASFGEAPMGYVRRRRIERARHLLAEGMSLDEIAARTGFCDAFHLSRSFKAITGQAPSVWRDHVARGGP